MATEQTVLIASSDHEIRGCMPDGDGPGGS